MPRELPQREFESERGQIRKAAVQSTALCIVAMVAGYALLPNLFQFPETIADRLAFAVQADIFVLVWVLFGVGLVSRGRRHSPADINGALSGPPGPRIAVEAAFLQNTLEQAVLAVGLHLALATLLPRNALSLIVVSVVLFGLGRATFLHGYQKGAGGRAFGMITTTLPTFAGLCHRFGSRLRPASGGVRS